uniref:NUDIX domain-containing protein n=1 Tax=Streptomyces sp. IBSBF 2435 TaxID=2903531 RepID=UPI002FDBFEC6
MIGPAFRSGGAVRTIGASPAGRRWETPEQAAVRELREETGWTDLALGPVLCLWEHDFTRAGVPVRQHEHIFLAYGPRGGGGGGGGGGGPAPPPPPPPPRRAA